VTALERKRYMHIGDGPLTEALVKLDRHFGEAVKLDGYSTVASEQGSED